MVDAVDAQLTVDTVYGAATQLGLGGKVRLVQGETTALAFRLRGEGGLVSHAPRRPRTTGVRYVTGLRNYAIEPELILSTRHMTGSLWVDAGAQITFDLEPQSRRAAGGRPRRLPGRRQRSPRARRRAGLFRAASCLRGAGRGGALQPGRLSAHPLCDRGLQLSGVSRLPD